MGLENLKSVWSNISLNTNDLNNKYPQDKSGLHAPPHMDVADPIAKFSNQHPTEHTALDIDIIEPFIPQSILDATTYVWDSVLNEPLDLTGTISPFETPLLSESL